VRAVASKALAGLATFRRDAFQGETRSRVAAVEMSKAIGHWKIAMLAVVPRHTASPVK
jgi:hypothetical protein